MTPSGRWADKAIPVRSTETGRLLGVWLVRLRIKHIGWGGREL